MREDQTHIDHGIIMEDPERSSRTTYGLTDTPNRIIFPVRNATNMPPRINPNTSTQAPKKVKIAATTNRTVIGVSSISSSTVVCRSNQGIVSSRTNQRRNRKFKQKSESGFYHRQQRSLKLMNKNLKLSKKRLTLTRTQAQFFLRRRFVLVAKMHNHLPSNYNGTGS